MIEVWLLLLIIIGIYGLYELIFTKHNVRWVLLVAWWVGSGFIIAGGQA